MTMIFQVENLDRASHAALPHDCRACAWWQGYEGGWPSVDDATDWFNRAAEPVGHWGKIATLNDDLVGFVQYGPAPLFPRARLLSGEVRRDSVLLACSHAAFPEYETTRKSLVLSALADLREADVEFVEAFCVDDAAAVDECRFFSRSFLSGCGFYPAASAGAATLMRLELGGAQTARPKRAGAGQRIINRIKRSSPSPSPATLCRKRPAAKAGAASGS